MRNVFRPASLLLYALALISFFLIGLLLAKWTGAGEGQGLAAGAIVLFYGMVSAGVALIVSFIVAYHFSIKQIILLNKTLSAVLLVMAILIFLQIKHNLSTQTDAIVLPPKTETPD
jgi:hypothetical protein